MYEEITVGIEAEKRENATKIMQRKKKAVGQRIG